MDRYHVFCPYCGHRFRCAEVAEPGEEFCVGDAMICMWCGQAGALEPNWRVRPSTSEDIGRWSCLNPIGWESIEMRMSRWRQAAARRKEGEG